MTGQGKRYYWLKLHENFFRQAVIRFLRKMPEGDSIVIIYLELLLMSIKTDGYVRTDGLYDTMEKDLALILDEEEMKIRLALTALEKAGLLVRGTGEYEAQMTKYPEMVGTGSETAGAQRMRDFRQRKALPEIKDGRKASHCDTHVTPPLHPRDVEREIEKEIEIEKPSCQEPSSDDSRPEPKKRASSNKTAMAEAETEGDVFLKVPLNTGDLFWISRIWLEKQREFYPGINIELVCRQAAGWLENNPKYRKTRGGMSRFLSSWFNREQDKASKPYRKPAQTSRPNGWTSYVTPEVRDEYNALAQMISAKDRLSIRQNAERRAHENSGSEDSGEHGAAQDPDLLPGKTG